MSLENLKNLTDAFGNKANSPKLKREVSPQIQEPEYVKKPIIKPKSTPTIQQKITPRCTELEAITFRADYDDMQRLREIRSLVKSERNRSPKRDGVKRERITDNMFLRALVKIFVNHPLSLEAMDLSSIENENDVFREVSKAFKNVKSRGLNNISELIH